MWRAPGGGARAIRDEQCRAVVAGIEKCLDTLEERTQAPLAVLTVEAVAPTRAGSGEDQEAAIAAQHAHDLRESVVDASCVVEHAVRIRRVERGVGEGKSVRVRHGDQTRARPRGGDPSGVEVDADPAWRQEPAFPAADIDDPPARALPHDVLRPADRVSVVHRASVSTRKRDSSRMPGPNVPFPPMEAELVEEIPVGEKWQYEPKWDGFRGVLENDGGELALWSRNERPLLRYFPELRPLGDLLPPHSALDGEIVIERDGRLDFDAMQMRLHPAESRIRRLAAETPSTFIAFDILLWKGEAIHTHPLRERRPILLERAKGFRISPASADLAQAKAWLDRLETLGLDGIIAKRTDLAYKPGSREAVRKVKKHKTADCVIVGYRVNGKRIAVLNLGLYRKDGTLDFVGHTSGITGALQQQLQEMLPPLRVAEEPTTGRQPGMENRWTGSRWSQGRELEWIPVQPKIVCEVRFDKVEDNRFRHGTRFLRFRPDKDAKECTWDQVRPRRKRGDPTLEDLLVRA